MTDNGPGSSRVLRAIRTWRKRSEAGATASEYALLMGFIAMVVVIGIGVFGFSVDAWYVRLAAGLVAALS